MDYLPITDEKTLNYTLSLLVKEGVFKKVDKKERSHVSETYYKQFDGKLLIVRNEPELVIVTDAYFYVNHNRYTGNIIYDIEEFLPTLLKIESKFLSRK